MKILTKTAIVGLLILVAVSSHGPGSHHDHDHPNQKKDQVGTFEALQESLLKSLSLISSNKYLMVTIAVALVSLPSIPVFFMLVIVSKIFPNHKQGQHIINDRLLRLMLCMAVGSLIGDVFFCMLEHLLEGNNMENLQFQEPESHSTLPINHIHSQEHSQGQAHSHDHTHSNNIGHNHSHGGFNPNILCIILGIFFFYTCDRLFSSNDHNIIEIEGVNNPSVEKAKKKIEKESKVVNTQAEGEACNTHLHDHSHSQHEGQGNRSAFLYLFADFLHNSVDGLAIGISFNISVSLGINTAFAIAVHELPHEIGDFAVLIKKNYSLSAILLTQLLTATGALAGGIVGKLEFFSDLLGLCFGELTKGYLLGFTAGGFLYLALATMIPELLSHKKASFADIILENIAGLFGAGIIIYSHLQEDARF